MTDQLPIDQLLATLRREAAAFRVPALDAAPHRTALEPATGALSGTMADTRLEVLERRVEAGAEALAASLEELRGGGGGGGGGKP
ncbi:hypothetical protein, partial [Pseudochelatococcus sp. B33]